MKINSLTPEAAALAELGTRLARLRKQQGYSQARLAAEAGIGVATLRRIEAGQDSQLETWIKVLKAIGRVAAVDGLLPEHFASPMAEALSNRESRKFARKDPDGVVWGDERE